MFSSNKNTTTKKERAVIESIAASPSSRAEKSDVPSIIASDLKVIGNLISVGAIEIEGDVEGNITCDHITVRQSGRVHGDVIAQSVQIDGEVNGLVKGRNVLVSESGKVSGMLVYESLSVQDGAAIDGQCKYVTSIQDAVLAEGVANFAKASASAHATYTNGHSHEGERPVLDA